MNKETKQIVTELIANLNRSIDSLRKDVEDRTVLDGTPWAITINSEDVESVKSNTSFQLILGQWGTDSSCSFRAIDAQPDHFCGVITSSIESAREKIAKLKAEYPTVCMVKLITIKAARLSRNIELRAKLLEQIQEN